MKRYIIISILSLPFFVCCSKKQNPIIGSEEPVAPVHIPIIELGKGAVLKDGTSWNLNFESFYYKSDTAFQIRAEKYTGNIREFFFVLDIPLKQGIYSMEYFSLWTQNNLIPDPAVTYTVDGDQGADTYFVDTTRNDHFLEVIRVDKEAKTAEGRFQLFLKKKPIVNGLGLPDTMALTQGKFHLLVKQP